MNKLILSLLLLLPLFSCKDSTEQKNSLQAGKRNAAARSSKPLTQQIDSIVVHKDAREMQVFARNNLIKVYIISLGKGEGKKQFEGDHKTPEGLYFIDSRNDASIYYKNLGVSYPNAADKQYAQSRGKSPGGEIKIHGLPNSPKYPEAAYLNSDWTLGCVAVSNAEIDELYRYVKKDCPILFLK